MAFIITASCSKEIVAEFKNENWPRDPPPPIHQDYALLKVLSMLRSFNNEKPFIFHIQWTGSQAPLNFSSLAKDDTIYIAAHGNEQGLYAMGPNQHKDPGRSEELRKRNIDRLVHILTGDGSLKKKLRSRDRSKPLKIVLLSCRGGLGFHKALAYGLYKVLREDLIVEGAIGFTFGSLRTLALAYNEVLIKGIPWHMEYPGSVDVNEMDRITSEREKKPISYKRKKKEIDAFIDTKIKLENKMKEVVKKIKNTEVNKVLDELSGKHEPEWSHLIVAQFYHYLNAKDYGNLEFNMWFNEIAEGYVNIKGSSVDAKQIREILKQPGEVPVSLLSEK